MVDPQFEQGVHHASLCCCCGWRSSSSLYWHNMTVLVVHSLLLEYVVVSSASRTTKKAKWNLPRQFEIQQKPLQVYSVVCRNITPILVHTTVPLCPTLEVPRLLVSNSFSVQHLYFNKINTHFINSYTSIKNDSIYWVSSLIQYSLICW
jgi:hypothetical protein